MFFGKENKYPFTDVCLQWRNKGKSNWTLSHDRELYKHISTEKSIVLILMPAIITIVYQNKQSLVQYIVYKFKRSWDEFVKVTHMPASNLRNKIHYRDKNTFPAKRNYKPVVLFKGRKWKVVLLLWQMVQILSSDENKSISNNVLQMSHVWLHLAGWNVSSQQSWCCYRSFTDNIMIVILLRACSIDSIPE